MTRHHEDAFGTGHGVLALTRNVDIVSRGDPVMAPPRSSLAIDLPDYPDELAPPVVDRRFAGQLAALFCAGVVLGAGAALLAVL